MQMDAAVLGDRLPEVTWKPGFPSATVPSSLPRIACRFECFQWEATMAPTAICGHFSEVSAGGGSLRPKPSTSIARYGKSLTTVGPTIITLHEFIVPGLIIELHYMCSVCLN